MTFRSRRLLDLAHDCTTCFARFPHQCVAYQGCDPAHSDSQDYGRGHGHKAADWAVAFVCHVAHMMLDTFDRETKKAEWQAAHIKTMDYLFSTGKLKVA